MSALDVWLKFDHDDDEEPSHEANTFLRDGAYVVEWYHVDVGQVASVEFANYDDAREWLEAADYADFSS